MSCGLAGNYVWVPGFSQVDWERTRYHLKLARKATSLESLPPDQNSIETFTVLEKNGFPNKVNSLEKMH